MSFSRVATPAAGMVCGIGPYVSAAAARLLQTGNIGASCYQEAQSGRHTRMPLGSSSNPVKVKLDSSFLQRPLNPKLNPKPSETVLVFGRLCEQGADLEDV